MKIKMDIWRKNKEGKANATIINNIEITDEDIEALAVKKCELYNVMDDPDKEYYATIDSTII
jgi:hypothetical protein